MNPATCKFVIYPR